jgi:hypothetical protein
MEFLDHLAGHVKTTPGGRFRTRKFISRDEEATMSQRQHPPPPPQPQPKPIPQPIPPQPEPDDDDDNGDDGRP